MQKLFLLLIACSLQFSASSQYWQQKINYVIDVSLNDEEKTLDAFEKLTYYNNSPDTLYFIWFHLWPNAYKNDKTAFSDQLLENGNTKFYFSDKEQRGYINRLDFKVDGVTAKTEDHPQHIDIIKLILPKPLPPGAQIIITTPFHEKLPFNFSRGGYDGSSFQITQWYPKPAVYDRNGWHPMPYLDQGEFYSEFGSFDVSISVPQNYVVAATGGLQTAEEKIWIQDLQHAASTTPVHPVKNTGQKKIKLNTPPSASQIKTIRFTQDSVHDFAWFANKEFLVAHDTCQLSSGKIIDVYAYYTASQQELWSHSVQYAKDALRFYSDRVGTYPFNIVTVVQGPQSFGGGMEYPTITCISPATTAKDLDVTIAHEIGHNWFYGILASNERDHPWMDEGVNSFYEDAYTEMKYGRQEQEDEILYETSAERNKSQPIETSSENFSVENYNLVAYHKTSAWLKKLELRIGEDRFNTMMHQYYNEWKFRHPQPEDFKNIIRENLPADTQKDSITIFQDFSRPVYTIDPGFKILSPSKKGSINSYLKYPVRNALFLSPAIGANRYDKLMLGAIITNYKLPPNHFEFLAIPLYATGSKKFAGLGKLNYHFISNHLIRKTDIFLNASDFSMDDFKDTAGRKLIMRFQKLVPGFKFTFREKSPKTTATHFLQWKTYLFTEQSLRIRSDVIVNGTDTSQILRYSLPKKNRYLNQLKFVYEDHRALYPFHFDFTVEQSGDFIRPTVTANYFFNYQEGGLQLRFFAGKFIYLNGKTINKEFNNDRYFLNMTGPKGDEDYTYSDYFIGRNEFEGFDNQQIMIRDGGFKVRTDLLASKIGKTDNWLAAVNLSTSIPQKINPLSVLPVKIPLRLFLDIGTYAEAWDKNAETDRFLYDLGFQIPLFHEAVNFYFPILYNKEYSDYFKSTIPKNRFFNTMSFTIQLYNVDVKKLNQEMEF